MTLAVLLRPSVLASVLAHGAAVAVGVWTVGPAGRTSTPPRLEVTYVEAGTAAPSEVSDADDAGREPRLASNEPDPLKEPEPSVAAEPASVPPAPDASDPEAEAPPEATAVQVFGTDALPRVDLKTRRAVATKESSGAARGPIAPSPRRGQAVAARRLSTNRPPAYPAVARSRGWEGTAFVRLSIGADGTVSRATLERSSGWPVLDEAAVDAARTWRYSPRVEDGAPVASVLVQPVEFWLR